MKTITLSLCAALLLGVAAVDLPAASTVFHYRVNDADAAGLPVIPSVEGPDGLAGDTVVGVRIHMALGRALRLGDKPKLSSSTLEGAAEYAQKLGWFAAATACLDEAARGAVAAGELVDARKLWQGRLALEERRENAAGVADTLFHLGSLGFDEAKSIANLEHAGK